MIVFDTCVLSEAFRRPARRGGSSPVRRAVERLISEDWPLGIPGVVYQELLSGVRTASAQSKLREALSGFPILLAELAHHDLAADLSNSCRSRGIASSAVDCLIAAHTVRARARLFTTDRDFQRISKCSDLELFRIEDLGASG